MSGNSDGDSNELKHLVECGLDTMTLSDLEWFLLSGTGTPRRDKGHRWPINLCSWIVKKCLLVLNFHNILCWLAEMKEMKKFLEEVDKKQQRLERENEILRENMSKMIERMAELEKKMKSQSQSHIPRPVQCALPPPPPPLQPPSPPMLKLPRSNNIPRYGSASPRIGERRMVITPQDIANVKLRKTKENPPRAKPVQKEKQPLVTLQMLQTTRAKLGRARPVASSSPRQQLSELEKILMQEASVTTPYRRRRVTKTTFRSTEEVKPYNTPTRSPRSPRYNYTPKRTAIHKYH